MTWPGVHQVNEMQLHTRDEEIVIFCAFTWRLFCVPTTGSDVITYYLLSTRDVDGEYATDIIYTRYRHYILYK